MRSNLPMIKHFLILWWCHWNKEKGSEAMLSAHFDYISFIQADEGGLAWHQRAVRVVWNRPSAVWHHASACISPILQSWFHAVLRRIPFNAPHWFHPLALRAIPSTPSAWFGARKKNTRGILHHNWKQIKAGLTPRFFFAKWNRLVGGQAHTTVPK